MKMRFFFFNDTATTEIYTLSLHDALPISCATSASTPRPSGTCCSTSTTSTRRTPGRGSGDRKSTRLNSSHSQISYAVFCLKKKTADHFSYMNTRKEPTPPPYHVLRRTACQ